MQLAVAEDRSQKIETAIRLRRWCAQMIGMQNEALTLMRKKGLGHMPAQRIGASPPVVGNEAKQEDPRFVLLD